MTIRNYTPADNESIIELLRLNTPQYFAPEEEKDLLDYFENHIDRYFVAEEGEMIIGCGGTNVFPNDKSACLSWDIIHPEYQGKGIGSTLTKFRIERIKEIDGIEILFVRTTQHVYKFYEKMGFELKEVVKDYWAEGFDMYRMELIKK
jgi:N-acetylglutamate synthase-like GNAT family acetyltransferase